MSFDADSRGTLERLDVVQVAGGQGGAGSYALPDRKPVVIFFYCNWRESHGSTDAICDCIRMRRMAFSDPRTGGVAAGFTWLELDVDDPAAAPWIERYRIRSSPALAFCDPLGNEIRVEHGPVACGRLLEVLEDVQRRSEQKVRAHEARLPRLAAALQAARESLAAGRLGEAVHGFRNVRTQAQDEGYRSVCAEAEACLEDASGTARDRLREILVSAGDDRASRLAALRNETVGLDGVQEEIRAAIEGTGGAAGR